MRVHCVCPHTCTCAHVCTRACVRVCAHTCVCVCMVSGLRTGSTELFGPREHGTFSPQPSANLHPSCC